MKKSQIARASMAALLILCGTLPPLAAEGESAKKDVSDPVLQEIIATFGPRMPRFIDRHGKDFFVADETITRGSLINALYEFDKSLKFPRKDFVTRQEFEELKIKVAQAQAVGMSGGGRQAATIDVMEIINDLQPNMPLLLDNSLNDSKVFNSLREEVMARRASSPGTTQAVQYAAGDGGTSKQELTEIKGKLALLERNIREYREAPPAAKSSGESGVSRHELTELKSKLSLIERNLREYREEPPAARAASSPGADPSGRMKKELEDTRAEMARLNRRIAELERAPQAEYSDESRSSKSSALTKISLGLSMVAALFIAR